MGYSFIEQYFSDECLNYKYQFYCKSISSTFSRELYDWCLYNLDHDVFLGWHVMNDGVVIFEADDAMAFKLRWL